MTQLSESQSQKAQYIVYMYSAQRFADKHGPDKYFIKSMNQIAQIYVTQAKVKSFDYRDGGRTVMDYEIGDKFIGIFFDMDAAKEAIFRDSGRETPIQIEDHDNSVTTISTKDL